MQKFAVSIIALLVNAHFSSSASNATDQTALPVWQRWLDKAPPVPEFKAPASRQQWEQRRGQLRAQLWELLGKLPPRPSIPDVKIIRREERDGYSLEKLEFDNQAGAIVPGYLLLPKSTGRRLPAILYCHWHGGEYAIGKEELFQARHTPVEPGPALARRGYVVLAIDAYCFGERSGQGPSGPSEKGGAEEMSASKFNLWVGRTLWGMIVRDDLMALDYLVTRPEVDPDRIGVTGISMGATRAWWLMALDDRIKAGVAVACMTRYQNLIAHQMLPAHGIYYFVPGLLNHFDTEGVISLIAPRPVLFMTGDQDGGSPADGVEALVERVTPVYKLYGKEDNFRSILYPGVGHAYLPDMWSRMLDWMDAHLK
ncbi:MAG: dienelactone hydrolase family protein [Candidatus Omnitrophica bacterium]|nr:dienelactone hydrolase family protein [Candidatus Omnitrophota bacterium]